jgi:hypothetical protein
MNMGSFCGGGQTHRHLDEGTIIHVAIALCAVSPALSAKGALPRRRIPERERERERESARARERARARARERERERERERGRGRVRGSERTER